MAEQIQVNKTVLQEQIANLSALCASTELDKDILALESILAQSAGESADKVKEYKNQFDSLNTNMKLLFTRTLEFLQNKNDDFVQADEQSSGGV